MWEIEDRALDYLIKTVKRFDKHANADTKIQIYCYFFYKTIIRDVAKKARKTSKVEHNGAGIGRAGIRKSGFIKTRKPVEVPVSNDVLNWIEHHDGSIERVIEECGGLPLQVKNMLMKIVHKRPDEKLKDVLNKDQMRRWWLKIRPMLQEWARKNGLKD